MAPVLEILRSPITRGYRNKCEFSVGYMEPVIEGTAAPEGDGQPTPAAGPVISVGFRLATYKQGTGPDYRRT
jgi:hypothetical protein